MDAENPNGGKKPRKKIVPLAAGGAVLLALVLVVIVWGAGIGNFFRRSFSSPEKYYRYVEETTTAELAELSSAYYETLLVESLNISSRSASTELTVELGEGGRSFVKLLGMAGVDLSWLTDVSVGAGFSIKDSMLGYDLSFGLNKTDLLSGRVMMDMEEGNVYLQVPELTEDYIGIELAQFVDSDDMNTLEEMQEMQESLREVQKAIPGAKEVEKLVEKYLKLALSGVTDVDKSEKTLKVEGVRQKCTALEVTIDSESLAEILRAVLEELPEDKDLRKLIVSTVDSLTEIDALGIPDMDGEDFYEELMDQAEGALDDLDDLEDLGDAELLLTVYVDGKGKIVGRTIEIKAYGETYATVNMLMPQKGSSFGYEFSVSQIYEPEIALTGSGKRSGSKLTGDFELTYSGTPIVDLKVAKLDKEQLKKGYLNGSITVTPAKGIGELMYLGSAYSDASTYASMLTDLEVKLDSQMSKDSGKLTLGVSYGGEELCVISVAAKMGDGSKLSVPSAKKTVFLEEEEDLEDWLERIDWEKYLKKLDKTDLPSEVIDMIEEIADILEDEGIDGLDSLVDGDFYGGYDYNDDYGYGW